MTPTRVLIDYSIASLPYHHDIIIRRLLCKGGLRSSQLLLRGAQRSLRLQLRSRCGSRLRSWAECGVVKNFSFPPPLKKIVISAVVLILVDLHLKINPLSLNMTMF